ASGVCPRWETPGHGTTVGHGAVLASSFRPTRADLAARAGGGRVVLQWHPLQPRWSSALCQRLPPAEPDDRSGHRETTLDRQELLCRDLLARRCHPARRRNRALRLHTRCGHWEAKA